MAKSSKTEDISCNEKEAWGQLKDPRSHTAAVGARIVDNRIRDFQIFGDRITVVGQKGVAEKVEKWLFSSKMLKAIKKNTHFVYGYGDEPCIWTDRFDIGGNIEVELVVRCAGEYCYVAAYADLVPPVEIGLMPLEDVDGKGPRWAIDLNGYVIPSFPRIFAKTKGRAMEMLVNYIDNELRDKDDIVDDGD